MWPVKNKFSHWSVKEHTFINTDLNTIRYWNDIVLIILVQIKLFDLQRNDEQILLLQTFKINYRHLLSIAYKILHYYNNVSQSVHLCTVVSIKIILFCTQYL